MLAIPRKSLIRAGILCNIPPIRIGIIIYINFQILMANIPLPAFNAPHM